MVVPMSEPVVQPSNVRARFVRHIVAPTLIVILFVLAAGGFGLYWAARQADEVSAERQTRVARNSIGDTLDDLASQQRSVAAWPAFANELGRPLHDPDWLDRFAGVWLYMMFGHQMVYVLGSTDQPIYASVSGRRVGNDAFAAVGTDVLPLVRLLRRQAGSMAAPAAPGAGLEPGSRRADDMPHLGGIMLVRGEPMAISAVIVRVPRPTEAGTVDDVLVDMKRLDGAYLDGISQRYSLDGVRFSRSDGLVAKEQALPLHDPLGRRVGWIMWRPELPGRRILGLLVPMALILAVVLFAVVLLLLRSSWRISLAQERSVRELLENEANVRHLAEHDPLTGLPNRALFDRRLRECVSPEIGTGHAGLFMIDLDRFKRVNDMLGHQVGDALLRAFGQRLREVFRPMDMVARLGGDEFAVLVDVLDGPDQVERICDRLFEVMAVPFRIGDSETHVGISIGVALEAGLDGSTVQDLHRRADIALYQAKANGRNCRCCFSADLDRRLRRRTVLEDELRQALQAGDGLFVCYQPQVSAGRGDVIGLEALVRWRRHDGELVPTPEFIAIAEETGLIRQLGAFVLSDAVAVARRRPDLFLSVNLSPVQLHTSDFAQTVARTVQAAGVDPQQIELEITEGVLLGSDETTQAALDQLRQSGFRIALDDFGVGYSSLSYLRRLHVDKIKIDRSFIENIESDPEALALAACIVILGHAIGVTVTAEGIETPEQMRLMSTAGCSGLQGYLFSRPVHGAELDALLSGTAAQVTV